MIVANDLRSSQRAVLLAVPARALLAPKLLLLLEMGHRRRVVSRRPADAGLPPRCCAAMSCGVARVAVMRTNAIVLCGCAVVCSCALLCCAVCNMCGVQGKSRALHNTICQHALSIVSAVCPALRAMQHRQHCRIATSLLVASADAVSEPP